MNDFIDEKGRVRGGTWVRRSAVTLRFAVGREGAGVQVGRLLWAGAAAEAFYQSFHLTGL